MIPSCCVLTFLCLCPVGYLSLAFLNWNSQQGRGRATSGGNKKNQSVKSYSYIRWKVWYCQIWIQIYLGFIVLILMFMPFEQLKMIQRWQISNNQKVKSWGQWFCIFVWGCDQIENAFWDYPTFILATFVNLKPFFPKIIRFFILRIANMSIARPVSILMFIKKSGIFHVSKQGMLALISW